METRCALYRHFDKAGNLLYVGISNSFLARSVSHKANAHWYYEIARIEVEWCASREAALWAEDVAIRQEKPKHNIWRSGKKGPASRDPEIERQRQLILSEADKRGIKLSRISCLAVLKEDFERLTRG